MKLCTWPGCDNLTEGNTDYCGSHNRILRKTGKPVIEDKPKDAEYQAKVKRWKRGRICALKDHSPCWGPVTCHHKRGRIGELLMDERYWMPVCIGHHNYIEQHPTEAYENGWSELRLANEPHQI